MASNWFSPLIKRHATIARAGFAAMLLVALTAATQQRGDNSGLAITVNPMVLEFEAAYGQQQQASVEISNPSDAPESIVAYPFDWRTTRGGDFAIERVGTEGKRSLTSFLEMRPAGVTLKAGETRTVQIIVHMPQGQNAVAPVAWGGILLKATRTNLNSQITPGATIVVYNAAQQFEQRLQLAAFAAQHSAGSARFVARVKNSGETYVRPLVHLTVANGDTIARSTDVPFNAILPGDERTVRIDVGRLHAGTYRADLTIQYDDDTVIEGETHVTVR